MKLRLGFALLTTACVFHRRPALPPSIPPARGDQQIVFSLRYTDVAIGSGPAVAPRKCVFAHYTGWLTNGTKFDSSRDTAARGQPRDPISFPQSYRRVIAGWDLGFEGMKVGGKRRLFIPYQLGYGEAGRRPIPPKAELIFDVELMAVDDTIATPRAPNAQAPTCRKWAEVRR
jgi:peptidylprolyl isomerase